VQEAFVLEYFWVFISFIIFILLILFLLHYKEKAYETNQYATSRKNFEAPHDTNILICSTLGVE
jgi:Na+/proline symporter